MHKNIALGIATFWTLVVLVLCLVKMNDLPSVGVSGVDKYVHFIFHFVFTILWSYYFIVFKKKVFPKTIYVILLASLFFGVIIEVLQQSFTETRKADVYDVLANFLGALTAVMFLFAAKYLKKNLSMNK